MKKISIIGNLTRDAEVREIAGTGRKAINFGVAVNERFRDKNNVLQERTTFFDCTLWRNETSNTTIAQYLTKGTKVFVEGNPEVDTYQQRDGKTVAIIRVRVRELELLSPKPKGEDITPAQETETEETVVPEAEANDDLPF